MPLSSVSGSKVFLCGLTGIRRIVVDDDLLFGNPRKFGMTCMTSRRGSGFSPAPAVGALAMFIGTSNQLGEFESGLTAAWFGVVPAALIGGIGTIVVTLVRMRLFPELAGVDTP